MKKQVTIPTPLQGGKVKPEDIKVEIRILTDADQRKVAHEAVKSARYQYAIDGDITAIYQVLNPQPSPGRGPAVILLKVKKNIEPTGTVVLAGFPAAPERGRPFDKVSIQVTPEEFEDIKRGNIKLPEGYFLGPKVARPAGKRTKAHRPPHAKSKVRPRA